MIKTNIEKVLWYVAGFLAVLALGLWLSLMTQKSFGSAPIGLPSQFATSSAYNLGGAGVNLGVSNTAIVPAERSCASRVISTGSSAIMLRFATSSSGPNAATSSSLLTGLIGHLQLASTTSAYDSGIYGCDFIGAYSYSTSTITVTEFR